MTEQYHSQVAVKQGDFFSLTLDDVEGEAGDIVRAALGDMRRAGATTVDVTIRDLTAQLAASNLLSQELKFYLRAVTNAMIDVNIHAGSMTEEEAVSLMVDGGFQEEAEARNKWNRARLTSTQLSTYFVGSVEFWDIEQEARRQAAAGSGDGRGTSAVPEPAVVGGYGDTAGNCEDSDDYDAVSARKLGHE